MVQRVEGRWVKDDTSVTSLMGVVLRLFHVVHLFAWLTSELFDR